MQHSNGLQLSCGRIESTKSNATGTLKLIPKLVFGLMLLAAASACGVPSAMHVTRGIDPRYINDDVRFRTTYYFRTFDFCWDADVKLQQLNSDDAGGIPYRKIIPQTDTLYRYRMTGKADSTTTKVRFESGTLRKEEIAPFGKQIVFSEAGNGFYVRDMAEVRADAEQEKREATVWRKIDRLKILHTQLKNDGSDENATIHDEIRKQIIALIRELAAPSSALTNEQIAQVTQIIDDQIKQKTSESDNKKNNNSEQLNEEHNNLAEFNKELNAELKKKLNSGGNQLAFCSIDEKVRKGFQLMGPEGIKTFDQDERLVLAMSSSAKPLIEALQEYGSRILDSKVNATGQQLAVSQESLRALRARQALTDAQLAGSNDAAAIIDAAIKALNGENGGVK